MPVYSRGYAESVKFWLHRERRGELDFIDDYARRTGGPILELTSGAARVTRELARRGHTVYGVEMSRPMLQKAQEIIAPMNPDIRDRIRLVQGDMRNFAFTRTFPLICIPFYSFWHNLDETDAMSCVRCMLEHSAPGGFFLVEGERDFRNPDDEYGKFWKRASRELGFNYRYVDYDIKDDRYPFHNSFLVGWRQ